MPASPSSIDDYLAPLPKAQRLALERLRRTIRATVPRAVECIAYQVPSFRLDGRFLLAFGAAANHCSFYPGAAAIVENRAALARFGTSKGTVRFTTERPIPASLVRKLVKSRIGDLSR